MIKELERIDDISLEIKKMYEDIDSIKLNVDLFGLIVDERLAEKEQ